MTKVWNSIYEVHQHAKKAVNKQIKEIVSPQSVQKYYEKPTNKGWIGNSIESDWFGLKNNSRSEADFKNLGLELKVTPIKSTRNGWSAKERLVLNIFDFHDEYKRNFENSSFLEKANLIELMYYEYLDNIASPEYQILAATLFDLQNLPEGDKIIIKQDWEIITNKIKEGKAEELSDSLTKYLGATTKGSKSEKNMTTQPFSDKKAHRRSFTLKGSYMSELAKKIMSGQYQEPLIYDSKEKLTLISAEAATAYKTEKYNPEKIIKNIDELKEKSFEDLILERFHPYINKTKKELAKFFGVKIPARNDKASGFLLARKMAGIDSNIENTEEFLKAGIAVKIVTVDENQEKNKEEKRKTTEGFKIENFFNFEEIVNTTWEESELFQYLDTTKFLLIIFKKVKDDSIFKGVKFWNMPYQDLQGPVKNTWEKTISILKNGVILKYVPTKKASNKSKGYEVRNNLPKISDDTILHVRPDAKKASYQNDSNTLRLPKPSRWINRPESMIQELSDYYMTKQAFWLNMNYMYQQVKEFFKFNPS